MKAKLTPPQAYLKDLLDYDKHTGVISFKKTQRKACHAEFYAYLSIDGVRYPAHRVIWKLVKGYDPVNDIDHINGNGLDNRLCNLREATRQENCRNRRSKSKTGLKGVVIDPKRNSKIYMAKLYRPGKAQLHLGYFYTAEEAHQAWCEAALELHGSFVKYG